MSRFALAALLLVRASAAVDDSAVLLQLQDDYSPTSDGSAQLGDGDYGMEMSAKGLRPPNVELAESAGSNDIPALGGKESLTKEVINFKLWQVHDGLKRTFRSVNGSGFHLYGTKAWRMGRRAQATLFQAHGAKVGVISMATADALVRIPRELYTAGDEFQREQREKLMPVHYNIQSFHQACKKQQSNGAEAGTGAKLYQFAKISKAALTDTWTVERLVCDGLDAADKPHYKLAYSLAHHAGFKEGFEAIHPTSGVLAAVDADQLSGKSDETWDYARRVNAWLTKGEDPALFAAAIMVTQMPISPVNP